MHTRKDDALTFDSLRGASRSGGEVDLGIFLKRNSDGVRDGDVYKGTLSLVLEGRETLDIGSRTEAMEVRYAFEPDKFSMEYTGTGVRIGSAAEGKKTREKVYADPWGRLVDRSHGHRGALRHQPRHCAATAAGARGRGARRNR